MKDNWPTTPTGRRYPPADERRPNRKASAKLARRIAAYEPADGTRKPGSLNRRK